MDETTQVESVKSPSGKAEIGGLPELGGQTMARRRYQDPKPKLRKGKRNWTWYFSYRADVIENGLVVRKPITDTFPWVKDSMDTKALAQREIDKRMAVIQDPSYRALPDATFNQFAARWEEIILSSTHYKPSYRAVCKSTLKNHLKPYFGQIKLKDLNAMQLQRFATQYPGKAKTVRNMVAMLSAMWEKAKDWGYVALTADPFARLQYRRDDRDEQPVFSEQQMRLIIQNARGPQRLLFWLAAETGLRSGELLGLRVSDVDFGACVVSVRQSVWNREEQDPKTRNAVRRVDISSQLAAALQKQAEKKDGLIFCSKGGRAWCYSTTLEHLHSVLRRLWIPRCGFHAFRHGNASIMDGLNTPIKTRMSRLGHGSSLMTERYTHSHDLNDRRVAEQLGAMFAPETATIQ